MSDHDKLISEFTDMTGCDTERAKFYLESSSWDLGPALETYFDSGAGHDADVNMEEDIPPMLDARQRAPASFPQVSAPRNLGTTTNKIPPNKPVNPPSSSNRIATFSSIRKPDSEDDSDDGRDRDNEQEFYVGSGQEVLGPGKKHAPDEIIKGLFQSAREQGAEEVDPEAGQPQSQAGHSRLFGGSGMRLGDSAGGAVTQITSAAAGGIRAEAVDPEYNPVVTLRMWRTGFSVNDGPLRLYTDPANRQFIENIKRGQVPPELIMAAKGRELAFKMEDHREQDFQAVKRPAEAFGGAGHMLGSPAPAVLSKPSHGNTPSQMSDADKVAAEEKAKCSIALDSAQPATNIQIRMPDGSRLVNRFNEAHTVADVRRFIQLARPEFAARDFQMLAGFPAKPLSEEHASLKDAKLLNAAINVK